MRKWKQALREGWITGSVASIASAVVLLWAGRRELGHTAAPVNAVGHWVWDRESLRANEPSMRHTFTGYLVHHGASVFWGTLHARAWGMHERNKRAGRVVAGAAVASAVACCVDMKLTPPRLTPGFEHRISRPSLALVYAAFGLGLAAGSIALRRDFRQRSSRARVAAPRPPPRPAS